MALQALSCVLALAKLTTAAGLRIWGLSQKSQALPRPRRDMSSGGDSPLLQLHYQTIDCRAASANPH